PAPDDTTSIFRTNITEVDPLGVSEFPHMIVNQARVLDYRAEYAANGPARIRPDYGWEFVGLEVEDSGEFPVRVTLTRSAGEGVGETREVRAKSAVGCDGAHSAVRKAIGCKHLGTPAHHAWGVTDALTVTDFPELRT